MAEDKKSDDGGSKKGQFNLPYGSTEITKVPAQSPGDQRNIPYGSAVSPPPANTQPTASGSGGAQGGAGDSGGSGSGDGGSQSGGTGSQGNEG